MAGVKGKSGGARPNSGGARPGAGRKPRKPAALTPAPAPAPAVKTTLEPQPHGGALVRNAAEPVLQEEKDMLALLIDIARGVTDATPLQVRAAIAAVQYTHTKRENGGKKDEQQGKAEKVAGGRFKAAAPPKLVVSNGR